MSLSSLLAEVVRERADDIDVSREYVRSVSWISEMNSSAWDRFNSAREPAAMT